MTRLRGHVADRLIAEDRDPTPAETAHLDSCPDCFGAVRRRRPFDARLADAARDLVTEPLPREVLLVDDPTQETGRPWAPAAILASFLLVVAIGVGGFVVWQTAPGTTSLVGAESAEPEPPSNVVAGEPHVVEVPGDDVAFMAVEGGVMIVSRLSSPEPQVLAKVPIPVGDSAGYAMVCPWSDDIQMGFVYGRLEPAKGMPVFVGPDAAGTGSDDGLYLFAFNPFEASDRPVDVVSADGTGFGWEPDTFSRLVNEAPLERGPNLVPGMACANWIRVAP